VALLLTGTLVAATAPAAAAHDTEIRVSTGTSPVTDSKGVQWDADRSFSGGLRWEIDPTVAIAGTHDDALYRSEHYAMSGFHQPVPAGTYDVTLRMAEIYWDAPGKRIFDVAAEGATVLTDVDIFAAVGKNAAFDKTFRLAVDDGALDLAFDSKVNYAKVSAIAITRSESGPAPGPSPTKPGSGNTGVPPGVHLTPHYGNLVASTPGATYDGLDIHGFVDIAAPDVTIRRSVIRGGVAPSYNIGLVTNTKATNFVLEDSELVPANPSVWIDGVKGSNYTLRRVDVHGTVDGAKIFGDNVRIEHSWLHDHRDFPSDPYQGGGPTHNDGVQVLGGSNIRLVGNTITGASNAALQVTQDYSVTEDLTFQQNWVDDGVCSVNLAHKPRSSMGGITVSDNRFGRGSRDDCAILATYATSLSADGNVWDDDDQPVTVRRSG